MLKEKEKKLALSLAKSSINRGFSKTEKIDKLPSIFFEQKASFVTLKEIGWRLRGCIGSIISNDKLWQDIKKNAYKAAFEDPRFPSLTEEEIQKDKNFSINISILTHPYKIEVKDIDDFIKFLWNNRPGLIMQKGNSTSTFLPSVWKDLKSPEIFLEHLVAKAGQDPNYFWLEFDKWIFWVYYTEEFSEKRNNIN